MVIDCRYYPALLFCECQVVRHYSGFTRSITLKPSESINRSGTAVGQSPTLANSPTTSIHYLLTAASKEIVIWLSASVLWWYHPSILLHDPKCHTLRAIRHHHDADCNSLKVIGTLYTLLIMWVIRPYPSPKWSRSERDNGHMGMHCTDRATFSRSQSAPSCVISGALFEVEY